MNKIIKNAIIASQINDKIKNDFSSILNKEKSEKLFDKIEKIAQSWLAPNQDTIVEVALIVKIYLLNDRSFDSAIKLLDYYKANIKGIKFSYSRNLTLIDSYGQYTIKCFENFQKSLIKLK